MTAATELAQHFTSVTDLPADGLAEMKRLLPDSPTPE